MQPTSADPTGPVTPDDRPAVGVGMLDGATCADPRDMYTSLRTDCPVMRVDNQVVVSRSKEIEEVLRDPARFSSAMEAAPLGNVRPLIPLQIDPPMHVRYRRILDPLFAPKRVERLEAQIDQSVSRLVSSFAAVGHADLVPEFTVPFPSEVFLALLGLPIAELPTFLAMKDGIIRPPGTTIGELSRARSATSQQIYDYFEKVISERQRAPRDDLISQFLSAEIDGSRLGHDEICDICYLFLIAGLDTVSATLECMFAYLARHPEQRRLMSSEPDIIASAVEELLRWETPVMGVARVATRDTELGGEPVHAGDQVSLLLGAANIEPSAEGAMGEVDFRRTRNRHIAFGGGVHRCLGSHLARVELRVAMRRFHELIPDYELAPGAELSYSAGIRSIASLPIVFTPKTD